MSDECVCKGHREWLPERERAASEKAWDEGVKATLPWVDVEFDDDVLAMPNPYRERADREEQGE